MKKRECKLNEECTSCCKSCDRCQDKMHGGGGEAVYGLGMIGAAIYFISTAPDFWMGALGLLKAIVWPVFIVYEALKFFLS